MIKRAMCAASAAAVMLVCGTGAAVSGGIDTTYKPGEGLFFANEDNTFQLNLGMYGQFSLENAKVDVYRRNLQDLSGQAQLPVDNIGESRNTFYARKLRLFAKGRLFEPWITYKLEVDALSNDLGIRRAVVAFDAVQQSATVNITKKDLTENDYRTLKLVDFYVDFAPNPYAKVRLGQFKIPFGHEELVSDSMLAIPNRSTASDFFTPKRDRGAMFHGAVPSGTIGYALGAFNGTGLDQGRNADPQLAYAARITVSSFGPYQETESVLDNPRSFKVQGAFAYYNSRNHLYPDTLSPEIYDQRDTRQTVGVEAFWRHATVIAEGFTRKLEIDDNTNQANRDVLINNACLGAVAQSRLSCEARGFSVQGSWFLGDAHEVAARYSKVDNDKDTDNDERTEMTLAYTRFFRRHALRWTTSITFDKIGINAAGGSGFDLQVGRWPSSNSPSPVFVIQNPGFFPGLKDDKNRTIVTMVQWAF